MQDIPRKCLLLQNEIKRNQRYFYILLLKYFFLFEIPEEVFREMKGSKISSLYDFDALNSSLNISMIQYLSYYDDLIKEYRKQVEKYFPLISSKNNIIIEDAKDKIYRNAPDFSDIFEEFLMDLYNTKHTSDYIIERMLPVVNYVSLGTDMIAGKLPWFFIWEMMVPREAVRAGVAQMVGSPFKFASLKDGLIFQDADNPNKYGYKTIYGMIVLEEKYIEKAGLKVDLMSASADQYKMFKKLFCAMLDSLHSGISLHQLKKYH